jgi:hypothetical protein
MSNVLVKITSVSADRAQAIADAIRDLYAPNVATSRVIPSDKGGYHVFVTIYPREDY